MKEQYMKEVAGELTLSRQRKKEILRDLEEIFSSAQEHHEDERQVMERLGPPREYARNIEEQLGSGRGCRKQGKRSVITGIYGAAAAASLGVYCMARASQIPDEAIGFAQGSTDIALNGSLDLTVLFLIVGILAALVTVFQVLRGLWLRHRK